MCYTKIVLFVLFSIVFTATSSRAQQSSASSGSDFRIGIGVSLDLGSASELQISHSLSEPEFGVPAFWPTVPLVFLIPMRFGNFKIEPEVGIYSFSYMISGAKDSTGTQIGVTDGYSSTSIRVGLGLYYTQQVAGNLSAYVGPRLGIITNSIEADSYPPPADTGVFGQKASTTNTSRTDFFVGLTLGGEYFFSSAFSLGADVGFEYRSLGNQTTTETPAVSGTPAGATTGHSFETKEAIVARVYF